MSNNRFDLGRGVGVVLMDVDPAFDHEFNAWYDEEHFPERAGVDGFLWGQRYRLAEGNGSRYLALFGLRDIGVPNGEAYKSLGVTPRTERILPGLTSVTRGIYEFLPPSTFVK